MRPRSKSKRPPSCRSRACITGAPPYDDVVVTTPVTVPYVRYSIRGAHWFLAGALAELLKRSGLGKDKIDGLCVSSFTLAPDTAVGLTQHLGTDVALARPHSDGRRLRHRRVAPRRARGAKRRRDGRRLYRRRHQPHRLVSPESCDLQPVRARRRLSVRLRRRQRELCLSHRLLHADLWRQAPRISASSASPSAPTR